MKTLLNLIPMEIVCCPSFNQTSPVLPLRIRQTHRVPTMGYLEVPFTFGSTRPNSRIWLVAVLLELNFEKNRGTTSLTGSPLFPTLNEPVRPVRVVSLINTPWSAIRWMVSSGQRPVQSTITSDDLSGDPGHGEG